MRPIVAAAGGAPAVFPHDVAAFAALPPFPPGPMEAPPVVRPEHGKPYPALLADMKAARGRSRQSIERLATCDPRTLSFKHFHLGDLDLAQWWMLQTQHDRVHLGQIRAVKGAAGFPAG